MIIDQYKKMKNLFLRQSYIDAWEDYQRSIRKRSFAQWDYIVLTASNEEQANYLKHVFQATENALKNAEAKGNEAAINSAVNYNLLNTKAILSEEQYKRYLSFVNYYLRDENNFASLSSLK
jgi:sensor histidine kinase YesM